MRRFGTGFAAVAAAGLLWSGVAAAEENRELAGGTADGAAAEAPADAGSRVRAMMQAWLAEDPLARDLAGRPDVLVVQGVDEAALPAGDVRWGKSRALAYEGAFLDAMRAFVELRRSTVSSEVAREYFQEDIPEEDLAYRPAEPTGAYLERVAEKAAVLAERRLDEALRDSGMSEAEVQALAPEQKHVLFADRYSRRTLVQAVGAASGLVPLKTFEAVDGQGFTVVGVVAAFSQRMRALADGIARGKPMRADPEREDAPVADQMAEFADADLPREFGVRVLGDEQGFPVLVSFGQWGLRAGEGESNRARSRRREFAFRQAENAARAYLAAFVHTCTGFSRESTVAEAAEEVIAVAADGTGWESDMATVTDRLAEKAQAGSEVSLTGLTTLRTWQAEHPEVAGHQLVGAVVMWSPAREDAVRTAVGERPKHAEQPAAATGPSEPVESGSRVIMDESDF